MNRTTIETYNKLAQDYDIETTDFWERFPRTIIDNFIRSIKGKNVLDVGCGPGRDALILKEEGLEVVCLDASQAMVDICASAGLVSVLGDFNQLPFYAGSFDGVWAYTSLLHVPKPDIEISLQEISRVLKPGGTFGLGMIEGDFEGYRESSGVNMPRWFSRYTEAELQELLEGNGFIVDYLEKFQPNSTIYLNFICTKSIES
ncbi:MAG: class I SAM-dependent methyltransferase [Patescibacteria group bacterium]